MLIELVACRKENVSISFVAHAHTSAASALKPTLVQSRKPWLIFQVLLQEPTRLESMRTGRSLDFTAMQRDVRISSHPLCARCWHLRRLPP
jgi:hypothetical protein